MASSINQNRVDLESLQDASSGSEPISCLSPV